MVPADISLTPYDFGAYYAGVEGKNSLIEQDEMKGDGFEESIVGRNMKILSLLFFALTP